MSFIVPPYSLPPPAKSKSTLVHWKKRLMMAKKRAPTKRLGGGPSTSSASASSSNRRRSERQPRASGSGVPLIELGARSQRDDESSGDETDHYEPASRDEWEVEKVVGKRVDEDGKVSYLLKWTGFNSPSWEPEDNCSCDQLIDRFEEAQLSSRTRRLAFSPTVQSAVRTKSVPKRSSRRI